MRHLAIIIAVFVGVPMAEARQDDPDMEAICADTPCREDRTLTWPIGDGEEWTYPVSRSPYLSDQVLVLWRGEAVIAELGQDGQGLARLIDGRELSEDAERERFGEALSGQVGEASAGMTDQEIDETGFAIRRDDPLARLTPAADQLAPGQVRIETFWTEIDGQPHAIYRIDQSSAHFLTFRMAILTPDSQEFQIVSSCSVAPNVPNFEHFPYPVMLALFLDFRPATDEGQLCGFWDETGDRPVQP